MPNIVKNTTDISLLNLLAPHSCRGCGLIGSPLCNRCKNDIIEQHLNVCPVCHQPNGRGKCESHPMLPPIWIAGSRNTLLGDLIHDYKYTSMRALARPLAEIMYEVLEQNSFLFSGDVNRTNREAHCARSNQIQWSTKKPAIKLVPLPTISKHICERGFDHTFLIAKRLAKMIPNCSVDKLITRNKDAVQVGSSREARLAQASSAYTLNTHLRIDPESTYILFDDVWTTGASMQSAYSLLSHAGAKSVAVAVLALSHFD